MTGSAAAMGQMVWEGVQAAHQMQPQILGQPVELELVDTRSDRIEAANAMSRLIEKDKVSAIIGEVISSDTLAGVPIAERAGIPSISPTATNPLVTQGRKFAFRACFVDDLQGKVAARFAYENLKARKAALLIDQAQDYCVGLANFFAQEFKRRGGEIVATSYIQTGDQDFSAQISGLKAKNPDLIYAPNYYAEDALLAKQLKDLGVQTPILTGDGAQVPELLSIGGEAVDGMYFTAHFHRQGANTDLGRKFLAAYEKTYKKQLDAFAALGGESYFLLAAAMDKAGDLWTAPRSPRPWPRPKTSPASPATSPWARTTTPSKASRSSRWKKASLFIRRRLIRDVSFMTAELQRSDMYPELPDKIEDFCRKWKIKEFALFGSVLREDFRPTVIWMCW